MPDLSTTNAALRAATPSIDLSLQPLYVTSSMCSGLICDRAKATHLSGAGVKLLRRDESIGSSTGIESEGSGTRRPFTHKLNSPHGSAGEFSGGSTMSGRSFVIASKPSRIGRGLLTM